MGLPIWPLPLLLGQLPPLVVTGEVPLYLIFHTSRLGEYSSNAVRRKRLPFTFSRMPGEESTCREALQVTQQHARGQYHAPEGIHHLVALRRLDLTEYRPVYPYLAKGLDVDRSRDPEGCLDLLRRHLLRVDDEVDREYVPRQRLARRS